MSEAHSRTMISGSLRTIRRAVQSCIAVSSPALWPFAVRYSRLCGKALTPQSFITVGAFLKLLDETEDLEGDVVECGVWIGRSLALLSDRLRELRSTREIHGFDSFEGLPAPTAMDRRDDGTLHEAARPGGFGDATEDAVRYRLRLVGMVSRVILHKGSFTETLPRYTSPKVSFVHLDCDLYESYRVCLSHLWPKLQPAGVMVFDEFNSAAFPGARRAIDTFFSTRSEKPVPLTGSRQAGWVRKGSTRPGGTHV